VNEAFLLKYKGLKVAKPKRLRVKRIQNAGMFINDKVGKGQEIVVVAFSMLFSHLSGLFFFMGFIFS
jgi:hypothetical protein